MDYTNTFYCIADEWGEYKIDAGKLKTAIDHTSYQDSMLKSALISSGEIKMLCKYFIFLLLNNLIGKYHLVGQVCTVGFLIQIDEYNTTTARMNFDHEYYRRKGKLIIHIYVTIYTDIYMQLSTIFKDSIWYSL